MSAREWKPGDVVKILTGCYEGRVGYPTARTGESRILPVALPHGEEENGLEVLAYGPASVRPLVVIDPEDREQVERLDDIYQAALDGAPKFHGLADVMQAALREFANPTPPKPEEPTDPTARVTDRRDNIWRLLADGDWACTSGPDIGEYLTWARLAAERGPLEVTA